MKKHDLESWDFGSCPPKRIALCYSDEIAKKCEEEGFHRLSHGHEDVVILMVDFEHSEIEDFLRKQPKDF